MLVRQAVLDDVPAISAIYRSSVSAWVNLAQQEAPYEKLSIYERWLHGGPWMSAETCAVWTAHLLQDTAGIPLVAEYEGEVAGQAEVFISKEAEPYGYHMNISTLCVHQERRSLGIGKALINYILQMAGVSGCRQVTMAYANPPEFYQQLGFEAQVARYQVAIPAQEGRVFYRAQELVDHQPAQIEGWAMPMGRFQNAREEWERMRWFIWNCVPPLVEAEWRRLKIELTGQPGILHLHQHDDDPKAATVRLWTKNAISGQMFTAVRDRAARLGYVTLSTLVDESLRPLLGESVESGQPQWLYSRAVGG